MREAPFIIPPHSVTGRETACKSQLTVGDAPIDRPPIIIRRSSVTGDQTVLPEKANQEVGLEESMSQTLVFPDTLKQFVFSVHCTAASKSSTWREPGVFCRRGESHVMNIYNQHRAPEIESCNRHGLCSCRLLKDVVRGSSGMWAQSFFQQLTNPSWKPCL